MALLRFRRYSRVPVDIAIRFFSNESDKPLAAYVNNISEEGASLVCPFTIPTATTLEFDLKLPRAAEPVRIRADVLWTRPIQENQQSVFAHGLVFKRLRVEDRERLSAFIQQHQGY
jgi:hypothetical protein